MLWRCATGARVERICRAAQPHLAGTAARRHRRRGRQLLPEPWHRSRRHARGVAAIGTISARRAAASTITQQTVKNLFLWQGRSFVRKALEIPLALWLNLVLPKRRILEIYLNIAEWGPNGEFGAEAGARYAFGKSARDLTPARRPNWPRSCPIRSGAAPVIRASWCAGWPASTSAGPRNIPGMQPASEPPCAIRRHFERGMICSENRRHFSGSCPSITGLFFYKRAIPSNTTLAGERPHGRAETKNFAVAARHAPVGRRAEGARPMSRTRIPANCAVRTISISRPACIAAGKC